MTQTLLASANPTPLLRPDTKYMTGYEGVFNQLPVMNNLVTPVRDIETTKSLMDGLIELIANDSIIMGTKPIPGSMSRLTLAIEEDFEKDGILMRGREIAVGIWDKGFKAPLHGHPFGYLHETLLSGKLLQVEYRQVSSDIIRPVSLQVLDATKHPINLTQGYYQKPEGVKRFNGAHFHSFTVLEEAVSLHYFGEGPRGVKEHAPEIQYFEDFHSLEIDRNAYEVMPHELTKAKPGEIYLIRSIYVSDFSDHYLIFHNDGIHLMPANSADILGSVRSHGGTSIVKLSFGSAIAFMSFHNFRMECGHLITPFIQ